MSDVKFGWRIPSFPVDGSETSAFINQIMGSLEEIDGVFDSAWISDHLVPWAQFQSVETDTLESWTTLSYMTAVFKKLDFGSLVLCNSYRNPALLAKMGATLDAFSGGRFILGIGAGWKEDEYRAYNYNFQKASVRIQQLEEAVQIIKKMWTKDAVTFDGKYFKVKEAYCNPKPDPRPPIMIGGGGERLTLRVVARHADWWNCPARGRITLEQYRHKLRALKEHCIKVRRKYTEIKKTWSSHIAIAETEDKAIEIARSNPFITGETRFNAMQAHFVGTPEQVLEKLQKLIDIGVDYFIFRFLDFPSMRGTKLFIDKIITKLK